MYLLTFLSLSNYVKQVTIFERFLCIYTEICCILIRMFGNTGLRCNRSQCSICVGLLVLHYYVQYTEVKADRRNDQIGSHFVQVYMQLYIYHMID